jgi:LPS export ABC transporter protein LptC
MGSVLLVGFLILVSFLGFPGFEEKPAERPNRHSDLADLSLSGVSFVQSRDGVKEWTLHAKEAHFFEKDQTALFKKVVVEMETQTGEPLTLSSDAGQMDMAGKRFSMHQEKEPVLASFHGGYTVKTAKLDWAADEKAVRSDGKVEISGNGIFVRGEGLQIFLDRSELTVLGDVHANMD